MTVHASNSSQDIDLNANESTSAPEKNNDDLSFKENLKIASEIDLSRDKHVSPAYLRDIQQVPNKVCECCKHFLFDKDVVREHSHLLSFLLNPNA